MIEKSTLAYGKTRMHRNAPLDPHGYLLIVPGYSESVTHNRKLINTLADKGYDTFGFSSSTGDTSITSTERCSDFILDSIDALLPKESRVIVAAHSFGSVAVLRAAKKRPERFSQIILMQPSGLSDPLTLFEAIYRVSKKTLRNHIYILKIARLSFSASPHSLSIYDVIRAHASSALYIAKDPLSALSEAKEAIIYSTIEDIRTVQSLGVPVSIIVARKDDLFGSMDSRTYESLVALPGAYSTLCDSAAGHDSFWMQPEQTADSIYMLVKDVSL